MVDGAVLLSSLASNSYRKCKNVILMSSLKKGMFISLPRTFHNTANTFSILFRWRLTVLRKGKRSRIEIQYNGRGALAIGKISPRQPPFVDLLGKEWWKHTNSWIPHLYIISCRWSSICKPPSPCFTNCSVSYPMLYVRSLTCLFAFWVIFRVSFCLKLFIW